MKNIRNHALTCLTAMFLVIIFASQTWATTLESGVPFNSSLNSMTYMNVDIVVPDGATGMTVSITNGSGDLDLYLKYGSPVSGSTIGELKVDADIITDGTGADETISITAASTPILRAGTWYVTTLNLNAKNTSFTITATIYTVDHTVAFGSVEVGHTAKKSIKITNPGASNQIITSVNITGSDAARFWVTPDCPTIPSGGSHSINITFQPISPGTVSAHLIITSSGQISPILTIALTGTGTGAVTGEVLPLPTDKTNYPTYPPAIAAETSMTPATCKPIGVGDVGTGGDTVAIEIKLENPSGPYDAYLALQAPAIDPNEFFMLGQDGIFHPFSQSGLVKWKQSASGKIDEKPFGDFPVSNLPGGTYKFNFLLTTADSLDEYYSWQTSFFAPDTSTTVPDGSAGFFNGTLVVPNATILSGGQIYENSAPVSEDELTGIKKDGKVYLYHPALDLAELSEDNTKLAVAYFMTGLSTSEIKAVQEQMRRSDLRTQAGSMTRSTSTDELPIPILSTVGDKVTLDSGVQIILRSDDGVIEARNKRRRFAMVKTGEAKENKYLLLPRGSTIPTDAWDIATYCMLGGEMRPDIEAFDKIETFGAFIRLSLSPSGRMRDLTENQWQALMKDKLLVISLNTLDLSYFILEGIRQVASVAIPTTCASAGINEIVRTIEEDLVVFFTDDKDIAIELNESNLLKAANDLILCTMQAISVATGVGPFAIEMANKFISIISLVQWAIEDQLYETIKTYVGQSEAYDLAMLAPNDMIAHLSMDRSSRIATEMVLDLEEEVWHSGFATGDFYHFPMGITPGGVVMSFRANKTGGGKIITTTNWGTGPPTDIGATCGVRIDSNVYNCRNTAAITNSGRLFFKATKCWEEFDHETSKYKTVCKGGIYNGCNLIPIKDDIRPASFAISQNGKVLVFSSHDYPNLPRLYAADPSGQNLRVIITSDSTINSIQLSANGDKILFDYSIQGSDVAVPCVISLNGENMMIPPIENRYSINAEYAAISPDGNWIAYALTIMDETPQFGIAFIRSDGSEYHFVNTGAHGATPFAGDPISFLADSNSVVFSGGVLNYQEGMSYEQLDLFILDTDKDHPNLINLTNTAETDEVSPVVVQY